MRGANWGPPVLDRPAHDCLLRARTEKHEKQNDPTPSQSGIKLTLPTEARIEGTLVDGSSGKPVAGVEVVARSSQEVGFFRQKPVATDDNGKFSIGALIPETYVLELAHPSEGPADWVTQPLKVTTEAAGDPMILSVQTVALPAFLRRNSTVASAGMRVNLNRPVLSVVEVNISITGGPPRPR